MISLRVKDNFTRGLCANFLLRLLLSETRISRKLHWNLLLQVAEWTDEAGFQAIAAKYVRLRPHTEIEKNKTYIVTAIMVSQVEHFRLSRVLLRRFKRRFSVVISVVHQRNSIHKFITCRTELRYSVHLSYYLINGFLGY